MSEETHRYLANRCWHGLEDVRDLQTLCDRLTLHGIDIGEAKVYLAKLHAILRPLARNLAAVADPEPKGP